MKDRVYSLLSLCAKAGRLTSGNFSVESAVKDKRTSVAVLDKGFADQIINYISINENMEA